MVLQPQHVDETCWYYEEPAGIVVVREDRTKTGVLVSVTQSTIPWPMLARSLARKKKKRIPRNS